MITHSLVVLCLPLGAQPWNIAFNSSFVFVVVTGKVFTWGRADYGQLGRTVETHEGWQSGEAGSIPPWLRATEGHTFVSALLNGATEVGSDLFPQG